MGIRIRTALVLLALGLGQGMAAQESESAKAREARVGIIGRADGDHRREQPVTEREWLACDDHDEMLLFVRHHAGERKLRLFGAACCRAVAFAEGFDDGEVTRKAMLSAGSAANEPRNKVSRRDGWANPAARAAYAARAAAYSGSLIHEPAGDVCFGEPACVSAGRTAQCLALRSRR
jgi:hypothetical protein